MKVFYDYCGDIIPYDELTLEEKQELIKEALDEWSKGNMPYADMSRPETVVTSCLGNYNEMYRQHHRSTPTQIKDFIDVLHSMSGS